MCFIISRFKGVTCSPAQASMASGKARPREKRGDLVPTQPWWPGQGQRQDCQHVAVPGDLERPLGNRGLLSYSVYHPDIVLCHPSSAIPCSRLPERHSVMPRSTFPAAGLPPAWAAQPLSSSHRDFRTIVIYFHSLRDIGHYLFVLPCCKILCQ